MSIQHRDIPDAQLHQVKGAVTASLGQILTANGDGTASFATPPYSQVSMGWWDYDDNATVGTPIALTLANTEYPLTNDGLGVNSNDTFALAGVADIWDSSTGYFDFTGLDIGDVVDVRLDLSITTASVNNVLDILFNLGIGGTPYSLNIHNKYVKSAGTYNVVFNTSIYIGNANTKDNPARFVIKNDAIGSTVTVNGWFVRVIKHG